MNTKIITIKDVSNYTSEIFLTRIEKSLDILLSRIQIIATEVSMLREELILIDTSIFELLQQDKYGLLPLEFYEWSNESKTAYIARRFGLTTKLARLVLKFYLEIRMW